MARTVRRGRFHLLPEPRCLGYYFSFVSHFDPSYSLQVGGTPSPLAIRIIGLEGNSR
jgi:hypothetical protein